MSTENKPSLLKQILGAVVGGAVGLGFYGAYKYASPLVTAWLSIPQRFDTSIAQNEVRMADGTVDPSEEAHFQTRAQEIAAQFGANYAKYQVSPSAPEVKEAEVPMPEESQETAVSVSVALEPVTIAKPTWFAAPHEQAKESESDIVASVAHEGAPELPSSGFGILGLGAVISGSILGWKKRSR